MILIDVHEPSSIVKGLGDDGQVVHLETGDYMFFSRQNERVVIERKAISDLLSSISSGRLQDQSRRVVALADIPILLIEGFMTVTDKGRIRHKTGTSRWWYPSVQNFLMTMQMSGMYIMRSPNTYFTPTVLKALFKYFQKPEHASLSKQYRPPRIFPKTPESAQVRLLTSIPGVGVEMAKRMLVRFGSPLGVFNATSKELMQVHGVGTRKAKAIREILEGGQLRREEV